MKTITLPEFHAMLLAQGVPSVHIAFKCPACGTIQSAHDLIAAGAGKDFKAVEGFVGFSCVGRWTHRKPAGAIKDKSGPQVGCDWTLGGLFRIHKLAVTLPEGGEQCTFEVCTPEEAKAHLLENTHPVPSQ